jgi:hypothetical protein
VHTIENTAGAGGGEGLSIKFCLNPERRGLGVHAFWDKIRTLLIQYFVFYISVIKKLFF